MNKDDLQALRNAYAIAVEDNNILKQSEQEGQEIIAELKYKNKKLQKTIDEIKKHCNWAIEALKNTHPNNMQLAIGKATVASIILEYIKGAEDENY